MKHRIWSSRINIEDWEDYLKYEGLDKDSSEAYEEIAELNHEYLNDEKLNCNIEVPEGLVVFAEGSRWNGTRTGIASVDESNIGECLRNWGYWDDMDIEVCDDHNLLITGYHHDGTDYYTVRKWKSAEIGERVICMLDDGEMDSKEAYEYTEPVGDLISNIYGWN